MRNAKGMKWQARSGLILIFTLIFSVFMYQGWYKPGFVQAVTQDRLPTSDISAVWEHGGRWTGPLSGC